MEIKTLKKILAFVLFIFFCAPVFCAQAFDITNISDDDYGEDFYTPGLPAAVEELRKTITRGPVETLRFNSSMLDVLNNVESPKGRLNERLYYRTIARRNPRYKRLIKSSVWEKYTVKAEAVDLVKWRPARESEIVLYAHFKKDVQFLKDFENLVPMSFNSRGYGFKYFGVTTTQNAQKYNITPLFYINENDFAVLLKTKTNDEVVLYRTDSKEPVDIVYDEMNFKADDAARSSFQLTDRFMAPCVNIKEIFNYNELDSKRIKNTNLIFNHILETVDFNMENKGFKFKQPSQTEEVSPKQEILALQTGQKRRDFRFDKPFIIFIREKGRDNPYFMFRIKDSKYLMK